MFGISRRVALAFINRNVQHAHHFRRDEGNLELVHSSKKVYNNSFKRIYEHDDISKTSLLLLVRLTLTVLSEIAEIAWCCGRKPPLLVAFSFMVIGREVTTKYLKAISLQ